VSSPPSGAQAPPWVVLTPGAAWVIDAVLRAHGEPFLRALAADPRPAYRRAREEFATGTEWIRVVAQAWNERHASVPATEPAEPGSAEPARTSRGDEEIDTAAAAELLDVSERWVRRLALDWADDGRARKVAGRWVLDRAAVHIEACRRRDAA
jgi:hypothetical protein